MPLSRGSLQKEQFELVLEGLADQDAIPSGKLLEILTEVTPFSQAEIRDLPEYLPLTIKRSTTPEDLATLCFELKQAGGKVLIVKCREKTKNEEEQAPALQREGVSGFREFFSHYTEGLARVISAMRVEELETFIAVLLTARKQQKRIFIIGNGGSAANASHLANDLNKQRFQDERLMFKAISLTDNVAWLSAIANDEGYEQVFVQQLRPLISEGDVVVAISSSGNSPNILKAVAFANSRGAVTVGIVGFDGGALSTLAKERVYIPTKKGQYGFMEDVTAVIGHMAAVFVYEQDRNARSDA